MNLGYTKRGGRRRRATKLTDARTVKLPESVTQAAGWTSGQRLVPIVEGKSVVLVAMPEFGATKGIARALDDDGRRHYDPREVNVFPADVEEFEKLPAEQQLELVMTLWERILAHPDHIPVPAAQLAELERRLDEDDANPDALIPVEVALRRLREA